MTLTYNLSCNNDHKNKMFTGFSQLQKQEEFVDLTLAADGFIVKVHRNIIALASPYLREILKSMPNHSPVIFLNNVNHKTLSYILEYIYQGEVNIPLDSIDEFIEVSKSLHIAGVSDIELPQKPPPANSLLTANSPLTANSSLTANTTNRGETPRKRASELAAQITIDNSNIMQVQPCPTLNNHTVNVDYELTSDMDFGQNKSSNLINYANSIVHDINHTYSTVGQNQENTEMLQNIPLIDINTNSEANTLSHGHNLLQTQTVNKNTPVIKIISDTIIKPSQTSTALNNYKIIVKPQSQTNLGAYTEGLQNIPVIEIQHSDLPGQQDQDMTFQGDLSLLPTQTDIIAQAFQENLPDPRIDRNTLIQGTTNIFESGINSSEISFKPLDGKERTDALPLDSKIDLDVMKNMAQFSLTERGAIQMILNRYIYCCHHSSRQKKRWRCIDYRWRSCPALVDTVNGEITARKGLHSHGFHDKKLYKKHNEGLIFQTIELAIAAKKIAQKESLESVPIDEIDDTEL